MLDMAPSSVGKGFIDFVSFKNQYVNMRSLNYLFLVHHSFYCGDNYFYHISCTDHMFDIYGIFQLNADMQNSSHSLSSLHVKYTARA